MKIETVINTSELALSRPYLPDRNPALVYLARLGKGSRRTMATALDTIAEIASGNADATVLPWHLLRYQHTQAIRAALVERYKQSTANKHLSAMRGTLKEAWRLGLIDGDNYHRAVDLDVVRGHSLPAGRELSKKEISLLFEKCAEDKKPSGARDAALLAILYGGGLRRSEVVALDLADYDTTGGALTIRAGKGDKDRVTYATNGARTAISAWLAVRGNKGGPLLSPVNKGGRITIRRLSDQAVLGILRKRASQAGVAPFSPHDLRRTFVSHLLDAGADIASVRRLAGHASVATTARYDRRGEVAKKKAAGLLHVPYAASAERSQ